MMDSTQFPSSAVVIALSGYRIEPHVEESLRTAWRLTAGRPLDAGALLKSVLIVAQKRSSPAFRKLLSIVPSPSLETPTKAPPFELGAVPVTRPLSRAFSIAEVFLSEQKTIWGRDYVTLALLATEDPSLDEFANQSGTTLEDLRREWFHFVRSSDQRRKPEEWSRWWLSAGLKPPDQVTPEREETASFLLTWNPNLYSFDGLDESIKKIEGTGSVKIRWSTGRRKDMPDGSRVYLLRQGVEPRGLVGVGRTKGEVMEMPHWDTEKQSEGKFSLLVDAEWEALSREPLIERSRLIEETGNSSLWSTQVGGIEIPQEIVRKIEQKWPAAWERRKQGLKNDYIPNLTPTNLIAAIDSDTGDNVDSLNITRYVDAFARVIASRKLVPPLSIGLFGDWGSGKTFFMDLLEERVKKLAGSMGDEARLYWPNICQIRFNAWHYAETELWASLVNTIFRELRIHLDGEKDESDEFNKLLQKLEVAGELRKEAEENHKKAKEEHDQAKEAVADAEQELENLPKPPEPSDEELRKILAQALKDAVAKEPSEIANLLEQVAEWSGREEDFREGIKLLHDGKATVENTQAFLKEARTLGGRARFWWRLLSSAKLSRTPGFWITVAVLVLIPIAFLLLSRKYDFGGWPHLYTVIAEILTVLGTSIAWIRSRIGEAGPVFDRLDAIQSTIERKIEDAQGADRKAHEQEIDKLRAAEQAALEKLDAEREKLRQAAERERLAKKAVDESTSEARLGRFIRERASTADYDKHLGLIAMVHRDFKRLSELMKGAQEKHRDPDLPHVDRIVLYIDDLDRCHPPDRVVRVLEAVHLLLFFPLFVVVVGVDSRWVSRALYKYYEEMLADESMLMSETGANSLQRAPADSQDFLEKIFQVPFWLRRMDPSAIKNMIHKMISEEEIQAAEPEEPDVPDGLLEGVNMTDQTVPPSINEMEPAPQSEVNATRGIAKRVTAEAEVEPLKMGEPLAAPTQALTINQAELDYMDEVAPLMPRTPRSIKRFVNIYRLYKAALSSTGLARFLGTPEHPGNYRAVQVLLALVTGAPRIAKEVFEHLRASEGNGSRNLQDMVESLAQVEEEGWQTTIEALRTFIKDHSDLAYEDLKAVSPLVSRYSVHHMVSQVPGQADLG